VQQIGVKYYGEFQVKIPRVEVESIAATILSHANEIHEGFHMCIVGGYRRGKAESGDVDVVLSHPNEAYTFGFIQDIVEALEKSNWITHTLLLSMANSERGQTPVSWKGDMGKWGSGFDTLDKALLVWQDPNWPSRDKDLEKNPKGKNPNLHRRVDIIISPWKTVGCAVTGWTSGTTFQRDLRRYAKKEKNLKFDSSGIRSREDGRWVDFESGGGKAKDLLTAEKRVFTGLGLEWREPHERNTG
jgi:DNA polymerase IV